MFDASINHNLMQITCENDMMVKIFYDMCTIYVQLMLHSFSIENNISLFLFDANRKTVISNSFWLYVVYVYVCECLCAMRL